MSDKSEESEKQSEQKEKDPASEGLYREVEDQIRNGEKEILANQKENSESELKLQGFPSLSIDHAHAKANPADARSENVESLSVKKSPAKASESTEQPKSSDDCKAPEIEDKGSPYFRGDVSVIGLGDAHTGNHWDGYKNALETLSKEGLTHVALEMIPKDLNGTIKEYREAKEKLEHAQGNDRSEADSAIEELKDKLRKGLESLAPDDKSKLPPGLMTPDDLIKMIDIAHDKKVDVIGIEPKGKTFSDIVNSLKDGSGKDGKPIDEGLRDSAKKAFMDYFKPDAGEDERKSAGDVLENYLTSKFSSEKAAEYLKWLGEAKAEGLEFPTDAKFPADQEERSGDLLKPEFNWRDAVFTREIEKQTDKGAKVLVMAGSGHFTTNEGRCQEHIEFRKGVKTVADRLGPKFGHIKG